MKEQLDKLTLEQLLFQAQPDLRQLTFHSDGRVDAKAGARAKHPRRLYTGRPELNTLTTYREMARTAITKLIIDNCYSDTLIPSFSDEPSQQDV